jgi:hemoglobin-like flavoprotein
MTPKQKQLVQSSFEQVRPIADVAATLFYGRLFDLDPNLERLFKGDLHTQGRMLFQVMSVIVGGLDDLDELAPSIQALGKRHAGYGVEDHHYKTVGAALLWTLERGLGSAFTVEVKAAWSALYQLLEQTMKAGARKAIVVSV